MGASAPATARTALEAEEDVMRLPPIPPADLTPAQKSLYDAMRQGIASNFNTFKVLLEDGALMGPWNPWLHEPRISKAIWDLTMAMTANATLPDNVRQIVILVVGARYDAAYAKAPDSRKGNEVALQINEAERLRKRATRDRDEERYPFGERQSVPIRLIQTPPISSDGAFSA